MKLTKTAEMEALLFASGDPLTLERAAGALFITQDEAARLLEELQQQYRQAEQGTPRSCRNALAACSNTSSSCRLRGSGCRKVSILSNSCSIVDMPWSVRPAR